MACPGGGMRCSAIYILKMWAIKRSGPSYFSTPSMSNLASNQFSNVHQALRELYSGKHGQYALLRIKVYYCFNAAHSHCTVTELCI